MEAEDIPAKRTRLSTPENLSQEIAQIKQKSIWLPTECWMDTLKLLSRRQLLRSVQPACRRLYSISELHVPSLHIVRNFCHFLDGLEQNMPEAIRQYADLTASKADLTRHIRLGAKVKIETGRQRVNQILLYANKHRQMCVLYHSLELFHGCQLHLMLCPPWENSQEEHAGDLLPYLSLLAPTRPFSIELYQYTGSYEFHADMLLRDPLLLACPRLIFYFQMPRNSPSVEFIFDWLHHFPTNEDGAVDEEKNAEQNLAQTRIFNLATRLILSIAIDTIERCKQSLRQAKSVSDRRSFLLSFQLAAGYQNPLLPLLFKLENSVSGEVLLLEKRRRKCYLARKSEWPQLFYCLRRCVITELANADQFYRDTFQGDELKFRTPMMDKGLEAPTLTLR